MSIIYALVDENHKPRYIGKTDRSLNRRLSDHICRSRNLNDKAHKANWIRSMIAVGLKPTIVAIEKCGSDWPEREVYWIAEGKRIGWNLTNFHEGGVGGQPLSIDARQKISEAHKGKVISIETRQKISEARKGKALSEEHKAKIRTSCAKGFEHTQETIEKIRVARKGNKATLGRKGTPEQCANVKKAVNHWMSQRTAIRDDKGRVIRWSKNEVRDSDS